MIKLYNDKGIATYSLTDIDNFYIKSENDGNKVLSFDISPKDSLYQYIAEEIKVEYNNVIYNIKRINERTKTSTIECQLNLDDFLSHTYFTYTADTLTLQDVLNAILTPIGWTSKGAEAVAIKRSLDLQDVSTMDILNKCADVYSVIFKYDNVKKILSVIQLDYIQPKGVYFTDELNLKEVNFKGDSSDFYTKIIPIGKDNLDITSINNGKNYIENFDYSDKVITRIWRDERYTVAQNLLNDAIERLKVAAYPQRSYECTVLDLAKIKPEYKDLTFQLYDVVTLIDKQRKTKVNHRIVEYTEYPFQGYKNVATLSTVPKTIVGTIKRIETVEKTSDNNSYAIQVDRKITNTIKQDVAANTAKIAETYTKGETKSLIDSSIEQSASNIRTEVGATYATNDAVKQEITEVNQTIDDLSISIKSTGYKNLVLNSAAQNDLNFWTLTGTVDASHNTALSNNTISGSGFILSSNSSISQVVNVIKNKSFTLSLIYNSTTAAGNITVNVIDGSNTLQAFTTSSTGINWDTVNYTFKPVNSTVTLCVTTMTGVTVSDIIISQGDYPVTWVQSNQELYTTNVAVDGTGIEIGKNTSDLHTHISNDKFTISRGNTENINVSPEGTELQKTIIKDDLTVGVLKAIVRGTDGVDFIILK